MSVPGARILVGQVIPWPWADSHSWHWKHTYNTCMQRSQSTVESALAIPVHICPLLSLIPYFPRLAPSQSSLIPLPLSLILPQSWILPILTATLWRSQSRCCTSSRCHFPASHELQAVTPKGCWVLQGSSPSYPTESHLVPWVQGLFLWLPFHTLHSRPWF